VRLLLISDSRNAPDLLAISLRQEYFIVHIGDIRGVGTGRAIESSYDLVVLECILPETDGPQICRDFRALGIVTPILMLSVRDTLEDRVAGLDSGADDYLSKPSAFAELLARIHALLRRSYPMRQPGPSPVPVTVNRMTRTKPHK
jgi:DNA-binding response OmpR family regulator